jgi:hypothetical protein
MSAAEPTKAAGKVPITVTSSNSSGGDQRPHRKPVPAPPPAGTAVVTPALADKLDMEARRNSGFGMNQVPIDIEEEQPQQQHFNDSAPDYGDAPPSYEDAIASDLPPVQAPRPQYAPPPTGDDGKFVSYSVH